jgi:hypothetical protein
VEGSAPSETEEAAHRVAIREFMFSTRLEVSSDEGGPAFRQDLSMKAEEQPLLQPLPGNY